MKKNKIHITYKEVFEAAGMDLPNNSDFFAVGKIKYLFKNYVDDAFLHDLTFSFDIEEFILDCVDCNLLCKEISLKSFNSKLDSNLDCGAFKKLITSKLAQDLLNNIEDENIIFYSVEKDESGKIMFINEQWFYDSNWCQSFISRDQLNLLGVIHDRNRQPNS